MITRDSNNNANVFHRQVIDGREGSIAVAMGGDYRAEEQGEDVRQPPDGQLRLGCTRGKQKPEAEK